MAVAWARAEVILDANGELLPGQVRREAERAGNEGGDAGSKAFADSFRKNLGPRISGMFAGLRNSFRRLAVATGIGTAGMDKFGKSFATWNSHIAESNSELNAFDRNLRAFFKTIGNTEPMIAFRLRLGNIGSGMKNLIGSFSDGTTAGDHFGSMWHRLSHNTRQWTLIIGAVIGAMSQLAGLASAAGSGLFVLIGAFSGLITAGIFAGVAFARFLGDLEKVPEAVRPARAAFDKFGTAVSEVMDAMTVAAFRDTERAWEHFGSVIKQLQPGFEAIGTVVNDLITDLADNLDTSTVENLNGFLAGSARILDRVVRAVGRVGDALLVAFNSPAFQRSLENFLGYIDKIADRFAKFLTGPGLDEWLANGERVFGAFGKLLDTTGRLLKEAVNIDQLVAFIDNIDKFLQTGGAGILEFAEQLDIFGLLAEGLAEFGDALEPLAGPMADLAGAIHDVVQSGIKTLAPIIEDVAEALAPFVQAIADFMGENPKAVADALIAIGGAFLLLKGVKIAATAADMLLFATSVGVGGTKVKAFDVGKLSRIAGGLAGIGLIAAGQLIPKSFWDQFDIESNLPANVLTGAGIGAMIGGPWAAAIGGGLAIVYSLFTEFETTMNDIGLRLVGTFVAGPWGTAAAGIAEWFATLVPEEWATSDNPMERFVSNFATSVEGFGTTLTTVGDEIGALFTGTTEDMTVFETNLVIWFGNIKTGFETFKTEVSLTWANMWTALNQPGYWDLIAVNIGVWIGTVAGHFSNLSVTAGGIWSSFWATANNPAFWDSIGAAVGTFLANMSTAFNTKTSSATGFWTTFWVNLGPIASGIQTTILTTVGTWVTNIGTKLGEIKSGGWASFWSGLVGNVSGAYYSIIGWVGMIVSAAQEAFNAVTGVKNSGGGGGGKGPTPNAAGSILYGPHRILAGEAGPEAIVPLRRPLSQVDPSVRWLSAIAQGRGAPGMAAGGVAGVGRQINVAEGAIVVQEAGDGRASANAVLTRLAEYANG